MGAGVGSGPSGTKSGSLARKRPRDKQGEGGSKRPKRREGEKGEKKRRKKKGQGDRDYKR